MFTDALVITLVGGLALLLPLSSSYRSHLRRRLATRAKATVPAEQAAALEMRVTRRARAMGAGILVSGIVALVLSQVWSAADEASGAFFVLSIMFVAGAAGVALAEILWPGVAADGPRTARATSPTLGDYLTPQVRMLGRLIVGTGMVALVGTLLLTRSSWFDAATILRGPVPLLAVGLGALLLLSWWASHRILDAPQPARDETELYWQDAVRAQTLNSLAVTTPFVSLFALVVCGAALDDAASSAAIAAGQVGPTWSLALLIAGYLLPVALGTLALLVTAAGPGRGEMQHFRNTLWNGRPPSALRVGSEA